MTGRDLIIYILKNHLEDEEMFKNGQIPGFLSSEDFAKKCGVGSATMALWIKLKMIPNIRIGDLIYIPENTKVKKEETSNEK